jgi:hypothetical protein
MSKLNFGFGSIYLMFLKGGNFSRNEEVMIGGQWVPIQQKIYIE